MDREIISKNSEKTVSDIVSTVYFEVQIDYLWATCLLPVASTPSGTFPIEISF